MAEQLYQAVGTGRKNMFPVFTVEGGLTCAIVIFSGGEIGCDGPLPGVTGGENEIFAQLPGTTGIRRTEKPKFSTPAYPGQIKQLPVGHRVNGIGATCMAIIRRCGVLRHPCRPHARVLRYRRRWRRRSVGELNRNRAVSRHAM